MSIELNMSGSESDVPIPVDASCDFFPAMRLVRPDKEVLPYFPTTVADEEKEEKRIDRSRQAKNGIHCAVHSVRAIWRVNIISMGDLIQYGYGLALVSNATTTKITDEASRFICTCAWDVVTRIKQILQNGNKEPERDSFYIPGDTIAAAMMVYNERGNTCYGYHELFFNAILTLLHGSLGDTESEVKQSVIDYRRYYMFKDFKHKEEIAAIDQLIIQPVSTDEPLFAVFPDCDEEDKVNRRTALQFKSPNKPAKPRSASAKRTATNKRAKTSSENQEP